MEDILAIIFIFGGGSAIVLAFSPLGRAVADRIRGGKAQSADVAELRRELAEHREALEQDLEGLRREVAELGERVDFTERLLAKQRDAERLAPPH